MPLSLCLGPRMDGGWTPIGGAPVWLPTDLGAALVAWYSFADLATVFQDTAGTTPVSADGQSIARINDKSGNGRTLTQATAGSRPVWHTGAGLSWATLDGVDDTLLSASTAITDGSGRHSAGIAALLNSVTSVHSILDADVTGGRVSQLLRTNGTALETIAFNTVPTAFTDASGATLGTGAAKVFTEITAAGSTEAFVNGAGNGSTAVTGTQQTAATVIAIGSNFGGTAQFFAGNAYEAVIVNRDLTGGEHASLVTYLGSKCGLSL